MLAYFKYHRLARYMANILLPLLMTLVFLLYGPSIGAGYTLFVFVATSIIFHKDWATRIGLIIFILVLFSGSSIALLTYAPPLLDRVDSFDAIITFVGTSVAVSLMITYFFHETLEYEAEQAQLMASLKKSNTALHKANQELERFAYITSHDLKTPARNISSFLGLAERDLKRGQYDNLETFFGYAKAGAHQMNELIEDILNFSRLNHQKALVLEFADLNETIATCEEQLRVTYGSRFTVHATGLPVIKTAPKLLSILFMNLLDNAIKYNDAEQAIIQVDSRVEDNQWVLTFADNGIGIAPEFQDKVFEMFQRLHTPTEYNGTGIGLAMCRKVAQRLGGEIELQSQPGEGSQFLVRLPKLN